MTSRLLALFIILALAACSTPARQSPILPATTGASAPAAALRAHTALVMRVTLPRSGLVPNYVGPTTKGMTVNITGPTNLKKAAGLKLTSKGCKGRLMSLVCTLVIPGLQPCPSAKNCYLATVRTYDAYKHGKIPNNAHALSEDVKFGFTIGSTPTVIPMVLYGIPKSVRLIPDTGSNLIGSETAGYVEPKCSASKQSVNVVAADADGSLIVGIGAPKITLTSDDPSQLKVSGGKDGNFSLSPPTAPAYAHGGHTIHLTARAVSPAGGGHTTATSAIAVSYSGAVCGLISEFSLPSSSSGPYGIVGGPDGALWFTELNANRIGRMTTTGAYTEFASSMTPAARPIGITVGPDHNLWFAECAASKVAKITTGGALTEYPTLTASSGPLVVAAGADDRMWVTELAANKIAATTLNGSMTEYNVPTSSAGVQAIAAGPGGTLWFAEFNANNIARITTSGTVTETSIPTASSNPIGVVAGKDGFIWFAESATDKIGRITPNGLGTPALGAEFALPETPSRPFIDAVGPDGNIWFTEYSGNRIGTITGTGAIVEYAVPTGSSTSTFLTTGPDGAIWFTETGAGKIGRIY